MYGDLTELTKVPGTIRKCYQVHTELTKVSGIVARADRSPMSYKNDILVPRAFICVLAYRTSRSSGYGCECRTELPEVPGTGMNVLQNLQKFFVG